jgi:hypothetical protein
MTDEGGTDKREFPQELPEDRRSEEERNFQESLRKPKKNVLLIL